MSRHTLFFTPEQETGDFHSVLQQVQEYIAGQHSELLSDGNAAEAKANIKRYIAKFVQDSRVAVKGMTPQQLVDALYDPNGYVLPRQSPAYLSAFSLPQRCCKYQVRCR